MTIEYFEFYKAKTQIFVSQVTARSSGRQLKKRDVTLADGSGPDIRLTLWGEKAEKFAGLHSAVAAKKAKVSDWNGKSLSLSFDGSVEEDPDIPEARALKEWYRTVDKAQLLSSSQERKSSRLGSDDVVSLAEMKMDFASTTSSEQTRYYNLEVYVAARGGTGDSIAYKACERCNKKLQEKEGGGFRCPKCNEDRDSFRHRYLLRFLLSDATDHAWANAFDDAGTQMFDGTSAEDLAPLRDSDPAGYERRMSEVLLSRFRVRVGCRSETFNEESRLKVTVNAAKRVQVDQGRMEFLQKEIGRLKEELGVTEDL